MVLPRSFKKPPAPLTLSSSLPSPLVSTESARTPAISVAKPSPFECAIGIDSSIVVERESDVIGLAIALGCLVLPDSVLLGHRHSARKSVGNVIPSQMASGGRRCQRFLVRGKDETSSYHGPR